MPTIVQRYIVKARTRAGLTQQAVAERLQTTKQWVSDVERGVRLPSTKALVKLHNALVPETEDRANILLVWLSGLAVERSIKQVPDRLRQTLLEGFASIESSFTSDPHEVSAQGLPRLGNFPRSFPNLVVVIGDRRETPPITRADLLAHSLSASDLRFLMRLRLGPTTELISDKIFVLMDDAYLAKRFGDKNLLVIGSPAVNLAARRLTADSVFHFDVSAEALAVDSELRGLANLQEKAPLKAAWKLLRDPTLITGKTIVREALDDDPDIASLSDEEIQGLAASLRKMIEPFVHQIRNVSEKDHIDGLLDIFRKLGIVDPVEHTVRKHESSEHGDIALVSLGPNPFSAAGDLTRACTSVAGVHGPGTAQALRLLGDHSSGWPRDRPFGGVIRVTMDAFKDWPSKFDEAIADWLTPAYTAQTLQAAVRSASEVEHPLYGRVSPRCVALIDALAAQTAPDGSDQ